MKELCFLTAGVASELKLNSQTVQAICQEYYLRRKQFKKIKLRWRKSKGAKKSLGWIPFKKASIKFDGKFATYNKKKIKVWNSWKDKFKGKILCGCFSEDSKGAWYLNLTCEVPVEQHIHEKEEVGCDLGLTTCATFSDGTTIETDQTYKKLEEKLAKFQRHKKRRLAAALQRKIARKRKDYLHKETTRIARKFKTIFIGDLNGKSLQANFGKSSMQASTGIIKNFLRYKAIRHQGATILVDEGLTASTVTCSSCLNKTGPSGLSDLGVRVWTCSKCYTSHQRDVNAATNHLRVGRDSLRPVCKLSPPTAAELALG